MSLASLERELTGWLRIIVRNPKLRVKDIQEWSSSEAAVRKNARADEQVVFCPQLGLWASVPAALVKAPLAPCNQRKASGEEQE
jgi:hypothetical protein